MKRRSFLKACGMGVAAATMPQFLTYAAELDYGEAVLAKADGTPLRAVDIQPRTEYLFHYPFKSTPCMLIDLGETVKGGDTLTMDDGQTYKWLGGVGPKRSIVAFLAICAHQLQYPSRQLSMINYNPGKSDVAGGVGKIVCCAHNSVYDPAHGAKVEKGPAPDPLAAVRLEWDQGKDQFIVKGLYGHDLIRDFFKAYKRKLKKEYGRRAYKAAVEGQTQVVLAKDYSAMQVMC